MIYARSPYIVNITDSGIERAQIKLYLYNATKDTDKAVGGAFGTLYEFDIDAVESAIVLDISPFIREALSQYTFNLTTANTSTAYVWVTIEVDKDTGAGLSGSFTSYQDTDLACWGYSYPEEGRNESFYTKENLQQESGGNRFVGPISDARAFPTDTPFPNNASWDDGRITHWFVKEESEKLWVPIFTSDSVSGVEVRYYDVLGGFPSGATAIDTDVITATSNDESNDNLAYSEVPANAKSFAVMLGSIDVMNANIHNIKGNCDQLNVIKFINKHGVQETLHFIGRAQETFSVDQDVYKKSILGATGVNYDVADGQMQQINKRANKTITISTGLYPEGYNEVFRQLLYSDYVWILGRNQFSGALLAENSSTAWRRVNIVESDFQYKYSRYDKKINYTFTFEYANSDINDIA